MREMLQHGSSMAQRPFRVLIVALVSVSLVVALRVGDNTVVEEMPTTGVDGANEEDLGISQKHTADHRVHNHGGAWLAAMVNGGQVSAPAAEGEGWAANKSYQLKGDAMVAGGQVPPHAEEGKGWAGADEPESPSFAECSTAETERQELDCWYGEGAPANKDREQWKAGIAWWHNFSTEHGIKYALAKGSYLGQLRHPKTCFIPEDEDLDIFVDSDGTAVMEKLAEDPTQTDVSWIGNTKDYQEPRIVVYDLSSDDRPLYKCDDTQTDQYLIDRCTFNSLPFRVLFPGDNLIDAFMFYKVAEGTEDPKGSGAKQGTWKADDKPSDCYSYEGQRACTYVNPPDATAIEAESCNCAGVETMCPTRQDGEFLLHAYYNVKSGGDYTKPAKRWKDGAWKATGIKSKR